MIYHSNYSCAKEGVTIEIVAIDKTLSTVAIFYETIGTMFIQVRDDKGNSLYTKMHCTEQELIFAIIVAKQKIQTNIFEA